MLHYVILQANCTFFNENKQFHCLKKAYFHIQQKSPRVFLIVNMYDRHASWKHTWRQKYILSLFRCLILCVILVSAGKFLVSVHPLVRVALMGCWAARTGISCASESMEQRRRATARSAPRSRTRCPRSPASSATKKEHPFSSTLVRVRGIR